MRIDENWWLDFPDEFFIAPYRLRLDLDEEQFNAWIIWFYDELVKCQDWSCLNQSEVHGISEVCGGSSVYENYRLVADELINELENKIEGAIYYPMFDPIFAHHLPGTGWMEMVDGVETPVTKDPISDWTKWFPKRSCVSCGGREGMRTIKICKHKEGSIKCKKSCYRQVFESWCPIMNNFIEKTGQEVNRDLEKYLKNYPVHFIENADLLEDADLKDVPEPIREYIEKNVKNGESNERKERPDLN